MVVTSMLRLVTSPRIFVQPTPVAEAIAFVDAILALPGVRLASLKDEWPVLRKLCLAQPLAGNDLPDAWLASAVLHHSEHLVSFDRDFRKHLARAQFTQLKP